MRIRYIPANPSGNLTAFVLNAVEAKARAAVAAQMMARCPEGFEQVGFIDEASLDTPLPRLDMMGGEFCGNATRAFALLAAGRRGLGETALSISISGAKAPVHVELDMRQGNAYADMPLPGALVTRMLGNLEIPIICMEGIEHAVVCGLPPTPQMAQAVLEVMPPEEAQGVLFVQGARMTLMVYVRATDTRVWESSCGSGTVALGWYLARMAADGEHGYTFEEPGGQLSVRVQMQGGRAVRAVMGGKVTLGEMREIEL